MTQTERRSRRVMLLLIALFMLPLAASFALYYGFGWRPAGNSNHGELLQPIRQLPQFTNALRGKWALAYAGDGACDADCRQALVFARQTRLSLAQDTARVNWVLLATGHCCDQSYLDAEHRGIQVIDVSDAGRRVELLGVLPATELAHSLFVIDPLGNIVLRYDVRSSPRGLLDDMKKLLKLSHIG
jgi:hypothetical protein